MRKRLAKLGHYVESCIFNEMGKIGTLCASKNDVFGILCSASHILPTGAKFIKLNQRCLLNRIFYSTLHSTKVMMISDNKTIAIHL